VTNILLAQDHGAKAKRQQSAQPERKSTHVMVMSYLSSFMKIKPPADVTDFELCLHNSKSGRNNAEAKLIM